MMRTGWKRSARSVASIAACSAVGTTVATALCGLVETGTAAAPLNAVSHIVWGDKATRRNRWSVKYTAVGIAVNAAAMVSWAAAHAVLFGASSRRLAPEAALQRGIALSALAYGVDYAVVPRRLTPGFEARLSGPSLLTIYATLAVSIAVGELLVRRAGVDSDEE